DELRYRFNRVYGVLDTASHGFDLEQYRRYLEAELRAVNASLGRVRQSRNELQHNAETSEEQRILDEAIENATGRLVAPATVATKVIERLRAIPEIPLTDRFEEESLIMVETALRVGNFLEQVNANEFAGIHPLTLGIRHPRRPAINRPDPLIDFTPGAQG